MAVSEECTATGQARNILRADIQPKFNSQELLRIAQRIDQFVSDNGWSWCMMDQVYKILKACHG